MGDVVSFDSDGSAAARETRARTEASRWLVTLREANFEGACLQNWQDWLSASPANRTAWESIDRTDALIAAALAAMPEDHRSRRRAPARWFGGMAAAATVSLIAVSSLSLRLRADYLTGTAEIETVRLADGSVARLAPQTALRVNFDAAGRHVELLRGEASFDVSHNPARPFSVAAAGATVTVLGTHFRVLDLIEGTQVSVARGHVRVVGRQRQERYDLLAGDGVLIAEDGRDRRSKLADASRDADPGTRITVFDRPVSEVVERLRPWFTGKIFVTSGKVGAARVTGVFDADDPVRALQALVGPQGGTVTRITPWLLIVSSA